MATKSVKFTSDTKESRDESSDSSKSPAPEYKLPVKKGLNHLGYGCPGTYYTLLPPPLVLAIVHARMLLRYLCFVLFCLVRRRSAILEMIKHEIVST